MGVRELSARDAARLRAAPLTYEAVGHSLLGPVRGFHWFERSATLARRDFEAVSRDLLMWRLHEQAGLRVWSSTASLRMDTVVVMRLGVGPASLRIPCRVVAVVDDEHTRGFAYGTLPGHPEAGEESFVLRRRADGSVSLTISALSRPATVLARASGPVGGWFQTFMTGRYLRALDQLAT